MMVCLLAVSLAMSPMDLDMTQQDKKKTGVYKLTDKEKDALYEWVGNNYDKKEIAETNTSAKKPAVIEVLNNGAYLKLTDNSTWMVRPQDTGISSSWITEVEIIITPSGDPQYPSKLTNSLTKSHVYAKKVAKAPNMPETPLPPAPAPSKTTPSSTPQQKSK